MTLKGAPVADGPWDFAEDESTTFAEMAGIVGLDRGDVGAIPTPDARRAGTADRMTFEWDEAAHPRGPDGRFGDGEDHQREPAVERAVRVEAQLADAIAAGRDTASLHDGPATGVPGLWTKERDQMHREIVQQILDEHAHVPRDREAVMTGGLPGAGKSSVLGDPQAGISPDRYLTIDADRMKDELYARDGVDRSDPMLDGIKQQELASIVHAESSHLCDMLREAATAAGVNVALDRTMNRADSTVTAIDRLHEQGYSVRGIFVDVKPETSLARASSRYAQGNDTDRGGRLVPQSFIKSMADPTHGSTARATWEQVKSTFDGGWQLWNNDGAAPALIDQHV